MYFVKCSPDWKYLQKNVDIYIKKYKFFRTVRNNKYQANGRELLVHWNTISQDGEKWERNWNPR